MLFSLLSHAGSSFAPLKVAEGAVNAELKYVGVVLKHGHISPLKNYVAGDPGLTGFWTCDSDDAESPRMHSSFENNLRRRYQRNMMPRFMTFPPNCEKGDLTTVGMKHIKELGKYYRDYLVFNTSFLPELLSTNLVSIRSSHYDRSIRTAASFMNGFYPPVLPDVEQVLIKAGTGEKDVLNAGAKNCKKAASAASSFKKTEQYLSRRNESIKLLQSIMDQTSITDSSLIANFGDWVVSNVDNGNLPINGTDEQIKRTQEDTAFSLFETARFAKYVGASPMLRLIFQDIDYAFSKNLQENKFNLYVVDSEQIATIAALVGNPEYENIRFGSHLTFEIWRDINGHDMIRFVYNGKPLLLNGFNSEFALFHSFKTDLAQKGYLDGCLDEFPSKA